MTNFPYTMSFYPNKEFDLSNFSSIPSQQEKTYQNALDFYFQKSSEDGFGNPSSCNVGKMAGSQPNKQITHKLVERQRRKDMNSLYSELRSVLSEESIRGNRSVTDQLAEAANYVHYLKQQIKDLSEERDRNKTPAVCPKGVEISKPLEFQKSDEGFPSIKIKSFGSATFQVYINSIQNQIALSDVLLVLEECRVEVVSAASSVNNGKVFYTIHAKVADHSITNFETLYVKLQQLIGGGGFQKAEHFLCNNFHKGRGRNPAEKQMKDSNIFTDILEGSRTYVKCATALF